MIIVLFQAWKTLELECKIWEGGMLFCTKVNRKVKVGW